MKIDYDIRGLYKKEINEELMNFLAERFYKYLKNKKLPLEIYLGIDTRKSSANLASAFASKFLSYPKTKINYLGIVPTPILYYLSIKNKKPGVIITASHLPQKYNGIKFIMPDGANWVYKKINEKFIIAKPLLQIKYKPIVSLPIFEKYLNEIKKLVKIKNTTTIEILNNSNSTNYFLFKCLPKIFKKIRLNKSKIKIKSDIDGDRLEIYYKNNLIMPEVLLYIILKTSNYKKVGITFTMHKNILKFFPEIKFYFVKTGHSNFKASFQKFNLDFAMEPSYHFYFFKEFKTEAPIFVLFKFLKYLEKSRNVNLKGLAKYFPVKNIENIKKYFEKEKFKIKYFDELYFYKIINKDFVGINFRKSKTEENLWKIFIESSSLYYLNEINKKLKELIND